MYREYDSIVKEGSYCNYENNCVRLAAPLMMPSVSSTDSNIFRKVLRLGVIQFITDERLQPVLVRVSIGSRWFRWEK